MSVSRLLGLRYISYRRDRAALIIAGIALGVSALVSSRILSRTLAESADQTATPMAVGELMISTGDAGVEKRIADQVRNARIPGIASVRPLVVDRVRIPDQDDRAAVLLGVELSINFVAEARNETFGAAFTPTLEQDWRSAQLALTRRLVILSRPLYEEWAARRKDKYDPFVVRYGSQRVDCLPLGYLDYDEQSPIAVLGRNVIGMELQQASRFTRPSPPFAGSAVVGPTAAFPLYDAIFPERVDRIDVKLQEGADVPLVTEKLKNIVGERASVKTAEAHGQSTRDILAGIRTGFELCSAGAMIVGLFLVYNAMAVTVAERRHDIGILRSLGATRRQVVLVFLTTALILGTIGAALGIPIGIMTAKGAVRIFREELGSLVLNPSLARTLPSSDTVLFAFLAGIVTTVVAALLPSLQAAYQDPADAVRRVPGRAGGLWRTAHRGASIALIAGGIALILTRNSLPPRVGAFGGMMAAMVGMLVSAPILVGILTRLLQPLLRRFLPIEARLAADNLVRAPGRTGVVIGALAAGVGIMVQTAGVARSNSEPVNRWLNEVLLADYYVFSGNLSSVTSSQCPLELSVRRELEAVPGVSGTTTIRYRTFELNDIMIFLTALDAEDYTRQARQRNHGSSDRLAKLQLLKRPRSVLVSDNFVVKHGIRPGDRFRLPGPHGPIELQVADSIQDYSWNRGTIYIDRAEYASLFDDRLIDVCHVYLEPGSNGEAVRAHVANRGLTVQDRNTVRRFVAELIDRVYALVFLQQVVIVAVASLGVVTALLISVLQRKRELGLLRAVGASRGQVLRSVLWEAAFLGAIGTLLGIAIGLPLEWFVLRVVMVEDSGFIFDLLVPWRQVILIALGTITLAAFAGLLPAYRAVKQDIVSAIAFE